MPKFWFVAGCLMGASGVAAGAFGAHSLRQRVAADLLAVFETGVRYQMYHAFGLLVVAIASDRWSHTNFNLTGWLFLIGIILFSGSLYVLCLSGMKALGAITPLGGLCFLVAWVLLAWGVWKSQG